MIRRYTRLLWVQARASVATSMQYRIDFLVEGAMSLWWVGWNLIPLLVLFDQRDVIATDWDFASALVVIGWFTMLRGLLEGAINPSLVDVVDRIRTGEFDYILLKPADTQFLVSTARFQVWKLVDMLGGIGLVVVAFVKLGRAPEPEHIAVCMVMLASAALVLYSLWILVVSAAFWVVRLDNLTFLFTAVFDAARWPVQIFKGTWRIIFTFVIPLAIMTTFPAQAILGNLGLQTALISIGGALAFAILARTLWKLAIASYTSASS